MTREIKFRCWSNIIKDFTDGYVFDYSTGVLQPQTKNCFIMQFTGLLDKNGKEIYEGDILRGTSGSIREPVTFSNGRFICDHDKKGGNYLGTPSFGKYHEIIGNIYQNPELLK